MNDSSTIQVLLVTGEGPLRDSLLRMMSGPDGPEMTCHVTGTSDDALRLAESVKPDVALISTNLSPLDGFQTLQLMIARVPGLGAALIGINPEPADFRRALHAGARDLIELPVTRDNLLAAVEAAADVSRCKKTALEEIAAKNGDQKQIATKIVVFSTKGGTGKTFVATNLAAGLAAAGKRVALIDLDLQFGDVAIAMGLVPERTLYDLVQMYGEIDQALLEDFMLKHPSGVHVLPAPLYPDQAEKVTIKDVQSILAVAEAAYDFVLVDTPPFFEDRVLHVLDWSDCVFLIASLDLPSVKNIKTTFSTIGLAAYSPTKLRVIMNRADSKVGLNVDAVQQHLGRRVDGSISSSVDVPRALNSGESLILSKPRSKVGQELFKLLATIPGSNGHEADEKKRISLFKRGPSSN